MDEFADPWTTSDGEDFLTGWSPFKFCFPPSSQASLPLDTHPFKSLLQSQGASFQLKVFL